MGEAERLPEVVVAREGKKGAGDVLEVDELGGFEVWASVRTGRGLRAMGTDGCYLQEIMWRMSSSGRWIMVSGEDENCGNNNDKMDGCYNVRVGDNGDCDTLYLGYLGAP